MKRILGVLALFGLCAGVAAAQALPDPNIPPGPTYAVGVYNSLSYNYGGVSASGPLRVAVGGGTNQSGVGTITLDVGNVVMKDGRSFSPFSGAVIPPIAIDSGANYEVVTPSSVNCTTPQIIQTCQLTATFGFAHGTGAIVQSGDQGIQEAINDAASKGGGSVFWVIDSGQLTLSTVAATTSFGSITIPTRSVVEGASLRVNTTITGCTGGWSIGNATVTSAYTAANATLAAGTTTDTSTMTLPLVFNTATVAPVVTCTTANATAGIVHARVWGVKIAAPSN